MTPYQTIRMEQRPDGIAVLTLNRPEKRNALSIAMRTEIRRCLGAWRDDPSVGAVVVTGAGAAFCAGFDLDDFTDPTRFEELLASSAGYHRDLWHFPKPVIAAVNGPAMGGGFDLAVLCDLRLGSEKALFGHPEVKFGAPPIYSPLAWLIGAGRARELCLTGRRVEAAEAKQIGLLSEVVPGEDLMALALKVAATILEAPAATLRFAKGMMNGSAGRGFEEAFAVEHDRAFREVLLPLMGDRAGRRG